MKTIFTYLFIYCFFLLMFNKANAQEVAYYSSNCGTSVSVDDVCPTQTVFTVEVTGQPILGAGNFGLVEALVDLQEQSVGRFDTDITLVAPDGQKFRLATGQSSFPNYTNGSLFVGFRSCGNYPAHDDNNAINFSDGIFQPQTDFSILNNGTFDPNGTWKFEMCSALAAGEAQVLCTRLKFGPLGPTLIGVPEDQTFYVNEICQHSQISLVDPFYNDTCGIQSAKVTFSDPENALGVVDGEIFDISSGLSYTYSIENPGTTYFIWEVVNTSGFSTIDTTIITVLDTIAPTLIACPSNENFVLTDCNIDWEWTNPIFEDNCSDFDSTQLITIFSDGSSTITDFAPDENSFYGNDGYTGNIDFVWQIFQNGYSNSCTTTVTVIDTIAPTLVNVPEDITIYLNENCSAPNFSMTDPDYNGTCIQSAKVTLLNPDGATGVPNNTTVDIEAAQTFSYEVIQAGTTRFIWEVITSSGFSAVDTTTITILDTIAPTFIHDNIIIAGNSCETDFNTLFAQAENMLMIEDNCSNNPTYNVSDIDSSEGSEGMQYYVYYDLEDEAGNISNELGFRINLDDEGLSAFAGVNGSNEIDCNGTPVQLTGSVNNSFDATYAWTGPSNFTSSEQNPTVSAAGIYTLTANFGSCTASAETEVVANADVPDATLDVNDVNCDNNEVTIDVNANGNYNYEWTLNGQTISSTASLTVSEAGTYNLAITGGNGCVTNLSYTLDADIQDVVANVSSTEAINGDDGTATLNSSNSDLIAEILWDNGQTTTTATNLSVGDHSVTVTSIFGCEFTYDFTIDMATAIVDEAILNNIAIYPSPFSSNFNLQASLKQKSNVEIIIYDNIGKQIYFDDLGKTNNINESIFLENIVSGIYHLTLIIDGKIFSERIMKI